jgi:hypothetical protein
MEADMSLNNFIPQVWSNEILFALRKAHVFAALCNRDYEGDIKNMGDTVRINGIGDVTISNYTKDTDLAAAQALTDAQTTLTISQAKYFNFEVDDIDAAQQMPKVMQEATRRAAYALADQIDTYLAGFYTDVPSGNAVGSSGSFTTPNAPVYNHVGDGTTPYDYLILLGQYLTQGNVPKPGRWMVVAPWIATYLKMDPRFSSYNTPLARATIQSPDLDPGAGGESPIDVGDATVTAFIGMLEGMQVFESNNAKNLGGTAGTAGSQDVVLAGHPMAITFANTVNKVEAYRPPLRFADALKGLTLYGGRTVRPYALAAAYLQHP